MNKLFAAAAVALTCATAPAQADTLSAKAQAALKRENRNCELKIEKQANLTGGGQAFQLWAYYASLCSGGNNWRARLALFKVDGDRLERVPLGRKPKETPYVDREWAWSSFKNIAVNPDSVIVDAVTWDDDDDHMGPTLGQKVLISVKGGKPALKLLKSYKTSES